MAMQPMQDSRNQSVNAGASASIPDSSSTGATPDDAGAFEVCISPNGDGTYRVYTNDSDDDQDDAQGATDNDASNDDQTAKNIDEALKIAGQMLQEEAGEDGQGGAQAYWDQLAQNTDAQAAR